MFQIKDAQCTLNINLLECPFYVIIFYSMKTEAGLRDLIDGNSPVKFVLTTLYTAHSDHCLKCPPTPHKKPTLQLKPRQSFCFHIFIFLCGESCLSAGLPILAKVFPDQIIPSFWQQNSWRSDQQYRNSKHGLKPAICDLLQKSLPMRSFMIFTIFFYCRLVAWTLKIICAYNIRSYVFTSQCTAS